MKMQSHPDFGNIPAHWEVAELGDVADVTKLAGYEFTKHIKYIEDGEIIALRSLNVVDGQLDLSNVKRIARSVSEELPRSKLFQNDLLLTYTGSKLGDTALIDNNDTYHLAPNVCRLRANEDDDAYFLYVYLRSKVFANLLDSFKVGSGQPTVPMKNIRKIPLPLPPKEERKKIGLIFSGLTEKIELSRVTNRTLEQMAQALFKSWFVDFNPVKAKIETLAAGGSDEDAELAAMRVISAKTLDELSGLKASDPEAFNKLAETASLFSEKLVESELGLIPDGWEVKPFSEWVKITKGKNITKKIIVDGDVPVVAGGLKPAYFHNAHNVDGPAITISASGANAGYVNLYFENIWASDCSYISQSTTPLFFLKYVALRYNQKKIFDMQTGAAQPHIYPRDFERLMIVVPNKELCRNLEEIFASFFRTVANNKQQNINLAALRDTLLPKLLSGEIELSSEVVL